VFFHKRVNNMNFFQIAKLDDAQKSNVINTSAKSRKDIDAVKSAIRRHVMGKGWEKIVCYYYRRLCTFVFTTREQATEVFCLFATLTTKFCYDFGMPSYMLNVKMNSANRELPAPQKNDIKLSALIDMILTKRSDLKRAQFKIDKNLTIDKICQIISSETSMKIIIISGSNAQLLEESATTVSYSKCQLLAPIINFHSNHLIYEFSPRYSKQINLLLLKIPDCFEKFFVIELGTHQMAGPDFHNNFLRMKIYPDNVNISNCNYIVYNHFGPKNEDFIIPPTSGVFGNKISKLNTNVKSKCPWVIEILEIFLDYKSILAHFPNAINCLFYHTKKFALLFYTNENSANLDFQKGSVRIFGKIYKCALKKNKKNENNDEIVEDVEEKKRRSQTSYWRIRRFLQP